MIVKRFKAEKIFGYLDFDIKFNEDVSFLVGGNGSGKTTALRLMNALINPNLKDLLQIPFVFIELEIEDKGEVIKISAREKNGEKLLKISSLELELLLPSYSNMDFEYYSHKSEKIDDIMGDINRKLSDNDVIKKISEIQSPIFLGLERRKEGGDYKEDLYFEREIWTRYSNNKINTAKRLIRGSLGVSLMETEFLVRDAYKKMREIEEHQSTKLRDGILLSAFQYTEFNGTDFLSSSTNNLKEKPELLKRQKEVKDALSKIGVKDKKLSSGVDKFFDKLTILYDQSSHDSDSISIQWLLNKAQIDRMTQLLDIIDEHKSKVDVVFKPVIDFLSTVNDFYADSNKTLEINTVGQLVVKRPDGNECTIEGLSSGERQIIVIFAHAFFNQNKQKIVFIIDEPELSLHLGWQEKFSETIFSISPGTQFILATHSPEIVGLHKNKAVRCR